MEQQDLRHSSPPASSSNETWCQTVNPNDVPSSGENYEASWVDVLDYRTNDLFGQDDQHVAHDDVVEVDTACPPSPHCFGADNVVIPLTGYVTVAGAQPRYGHVTCAVRTSNGDWTHCTLSITELNLRNLPLPSLAADPSWLALLRQAWRDGRAWWRR